VTSNIYVHPQLHYYTMLHSTINYMTGIQNVWQIVMPGGNNSIPICSIDKLQ